MDRALEATLIALQNSERELSFLNLVRLVIAAAGVDEATAKASILQLNSEGKVEIDSNWAVQLSPDESQEETSVERAA